MSNANMVIYNEQIRLRTIELIGQMLPVFNQASANTIILSSEGFMGDFSRESFATTLAGAQRRVDRNAANSSAASTPYAEDELVGVKVAGGFGPILFEPAQMTYLQSNPEEAINNIAAGFADALLADQLNTAVGCAVAAVENQATLVNDVSALTAGAGALTQSVLNGSHAKFGDMSQLIRADVMTGAAYHKLLEKGLENGERLFESTNVTVQSILGKVFVVSDIPALTVSGTLTSLKFYLLLIVVLLLITLVTLSLIWIPLTVINASKQHGKQITLLVLNLKVMLGILLTVEPHQKMLSYLLVLIGILRWQALSIRLVL